MHIQKKISNKLTSSLALVQRGISTTMLKMVFSALAKRGISWKGEMGTPFFSVDGVKKLNKEEKKY
jgi:hypothetical protein